MSLRIDPRPRLIVAPGLSVPIRATTTLPRGVLRGAAELLRRGGENLRFLVEIHQESPTRADVLRLFEGNGYDCVRLDDENYMFFRPDAG